MFVSIKTGFVFISCFVQTTLISICNGYFESVWSIGWRTIMLFCPGYFNLDICNGYFESVWPVGWRTIMLHMNQHWILTNQLETICADWRYERSSRLIRNLSSCEYVLTHYMFAPYLQVEEALCCLWTNTENPKTQVRGMVTLELMCGCLWDTSCWLLLLVSPSGRYEGKDADKTRERPCSGTGLSIVIFDYKLSSAFCCSNSLYFFSVYALPLQLRYVVVN